jgi:dihydroxyacetone kinase
VAALLNGLGSTKYEELFVLWQAVAARLQQNGVEVVEPEAGEFVTSLDMQGCSLSLMWLDDELERLWRAPSDAPVLRKGAIIATEPAATALEDAEAAPAFGPASAASRASGACLAALLAEIGETLNNNAEMLGRLDAVAGDGDHGQGMSRGAAAALNAASAAVASGAGAASVLAAAGDAWADRAGGTSGVLWGLLLRAWSDAFSDDDAIGPQSVAAGARLALDGIIRLGGARAGDKTLVDAFIPFVETLERESAAGRTPADAWRAAAEAARKAAEATASLTPRLGRARPLAERSVGHRDPGAVSLALCAEAGAAFLRTSRAQT